MDKTASVELDLKIDSSDVDVLLQNLSTLFVLGVTFHIHEAIKTRFSDVEDDLHTVSQAVWND